MGASPLSNGSVIVEVHVCPSVHDSARGFYRYQRFSQPKGVQYLSFTADVERIVLSRFFDGIPHFEIGTC